MADAKGDGMQTFEQHLHELVSAGRVTSETAKAVVVSPATPAQSGKRGKQGSS